MVCRTLNLFIILSMPIPPIVIPDSVRASAIEYVGRFFEGIAKTAPEASADDHLALEKSHKRARLIERYVTLSGTKLLEIGSGYATNLATWIQSYQVDGYGTEPDGVGFGDSFSASRELFAANGIDPERIIPVKGETLPFADGSFDIVYSANVLEHTENPLKVLEEAVRVLRPGGILHFEMPNFLSCFEGHYMVPQPPSYGNLCYRNSYVSLAGIHPLPGRCEQRLVLCGADAPLDKLAGISPSH